MKVVSVVLNVFKTIFYLCRKKHLDAEVVLQAKSAYLLANEIFNKNDSIKNKSFYLCIEIVSLILSSTQQLDDGMSSSEVLSHEQERDAIFFGLANSVEIAIEREFSSKLSLRESNQKEELLVKFTVIINIPIMIFKNH